MIGDTRGDGVDDGRGHLELIVPVLDTVAPHDPAEIGGGDGDGALNVLLDKHANRPVEPGIGIGRPLPGGDGRS